MKTYIIAYLQPTEDSDYQIERLDADELIYEANHLIHAHDPYHPICTNIATALKKLQELSNCTHITPAMEKRSIYRYKHDNSHCTPLDEALAGQHY